MAKEEQCNSCKFYNANASLCYKDWSIINFDARECDNFTGERVNIKQETVDTQSQNTQSSSNKNIILKQEKKEDNQVNLNRNKKRHWLVSVWLYLGLFVDVIAIILLFFLINSEASALKFFLIIDFIVDLFARILLFQLKKLGYYIKFGYICLGLFLSLIEVLNGQHLGSISSNAGLIGFGIMYWIFSLKTSEGLSFFDIIGVRKRSKKPVETIIETKKEYRI